MAISRLRELRLPWTQQPQEAVGVDRDHPLGGALDALWLPDSVAPVDVIGGIRSSGAPAGVALGSAPEGRAILGSTSAGTAFAIRPRNAYPHVLVAYGVMDANNGWVLSYMTGDGGESILSVLSTGEVKYGPRRNYGTARSLKSTPTYAAGTPLCVIVQVFSDTDYRLYVNGSQANGTLSFGTGGTWLNSMGPVGAQLSGRISLLGWGFGVEALTDAQALAITRNPQQELWRMFESQRIWVPVAAAGGSTITTTASLGAAIQLAQAATASMSAAVQQGGSAAAGTDAAVQAARSAQAGLDGAVRAVALATAGLEAAVQVSASASASLQAAVQLARSATAALDLAVQAQGAVTAGMDAQIQAGSSLSASLDAQIQAASSVSAAASAAVLADALATAGLDGVVQLGRTSTAGMGAALQGAAFAAAAIDVAVQLASAASAGMDAQVQGGFVAQAFVDAAVQRLAGAAAGADAAIATSASASLGLGAAVALQQSITAAMAGAVLSSASAGFVLSAYVLDPSTIVRAEITPSRLARAEPAASRPAQLSVGRRPPQISTGRRPR